MYKKEYIKLLFLFISTILFLNLFTNVDAASGSSTSAIKVTKTNGATVYSDGVIVGQLREGEIFSYIRKVGTQYEIQLENSVAYVNATDVTIYNGTTPNYTSTTRTNNQIKVNAKIDVTNVNGRTIFTTEPYRRYHYIGEDSTNYIISIGNVKGYIKKSTNVTIDKGIPVLTYHSVLDKLDTSQINDSTHITTAQFKRNMDYLKNNGFTTIHIDDLELYLNGQKNLNSKTVVITFDDGLSEIKTTAYPILKTNSQKATQFMIAYRVNRFSTTLSSSQMSQMSDVFKYEGHTYDMHHQLSNGGSAFVTAVNRNVDGSAILTNGQVTSLGRDNTVAEIRADLLKAKNVHSSLGFKTPIYFAYPLGQYNSNSRTALKGEDYKLAFTVQEGYVKTNVDTYLIPRFSVYQRTTDTDFAKIVYGNK